jgi:hypothetical protein
LKIEYELNQKNLEVIIYFKNTQLYIVLKINSKEFYENSFDLEELKKNNEYFNMYDNINEIYNDIKTIIEQKNYFIQELENSFSLILKIKSKNIILPLNKSNSDIKYIILELYENNIILTKKYEELSEEKKQLSKKYLELFEKYEKIIEEVKYLKSEILTLKNKYDIKNEKEEEKKEEEKEEDIDIENLKNFFDKKPKKLNLIFQGTKNGEYSEDFFKYCGGKDNLLLLLEDQNNNKFGGFISQKIPKNNLNNIILKDENAFLFFLTNNKKFKVLKPENAIVIYRTFFLCFGGDYLENDLFISNCFFELKSGMNLKTTYGDSNYEISNGQSYFLLKEFKVFQTIFN